mgnify:FL=1
MMHTIRFFDDGGIFLEEFAYNNAIVPHLGSDVVVNDMRYFVTDVLITYEGDQQCVDVTVERINELD